MESKKGIQLSQAFGAVLTLVLVAVLVIIAIVIFVQLSTSFTGTTSVTTTNETESYINTTGYTLAGAANCSSAGFVLTTIWGSGNQSNGTQDAIDRIPADGYNTTISLTNATVSTAGIVTNASNANYPNTSMSYTYTWGSEACDASENMTDEFGNYTSLIGLVGTIIFLGLVIGILVAAFAFGARRET